MARRQDDETLLDTLIEAAYRSATETSWDDFLAVYGAAFPHSKSSLAVFDTTVPAVDAFHTVNYDPTAIETYAAHYARLNPWVEMTLRPDWDLLWARKVVPFDKLFRTEFYQDWVRPNEDVAGGFAVRLAGTAERSFIITNNYNLRHESAAARQYAVMERLHPHLKRAFELQRRLDGQRIEIDALDTALDRLRGAVFVVDARCRLLARNREAERLMTQGTLFAARGFHVLKFRSVLDQIAVETRVHQAAHGLVPRGAPLLALGTETGHRRHAFVAPLAAAPDASPSARAERPVVLLILDAEASATHRAGDIGAAFGLSKAEARLAAGLAAGKTLRDVADAASISYETARTQLRSLFQKTGTSRQQDLIRVIVTLTRGG